MIRQLSNFLQEEEAMGVIEMVLIIMVLVGLAMVFKTQINGVVTTIFIKLKTQIGAF